MTEIEVLVSHRDRAVVRVDDVFVKVTADHAKTDREMAAMAAAPVPVPTVLWREQEAYALDRVPGRPLDDTCSTIAWSAAGAVARAIHDAAPPAEITEVFVAAEARGWAEHDARWAVDAGALPAAAADRHLDAVAALEGREVPSVFLHGDLQPAHIFFDGTRVTGVIDWGDSCMGDPLFELAVLTSREPHRIGDVLAGYGADVDLEVVTAWRHQRWLGELRWMHDHGFPIADRAAFLS